MLEQGDLVPHFTVTTVQGQPVRYATMWQRRNLVLITMPTSDSESSRAYLGQLDGVVPALRAQQTECVVTRDSVAGVACPGVIVADRWGEIVYVVAGSDVAALPRPAELVEWVTYLQCQCPECQGEAK